VTDRNCEVPFQAILGNALMDIRHSTSRQDHPQIYWLGAHHPAVGATIASVHDFLQGSSQTEGLPRSFAYLSNALASWVSFSATPH
jgi:hypothetical protein